MNEVGPAMEGAAGVVPLSFTELENWRKSTGTNAAPWEIRLLRNLSRAYVSQYHKSSDPMCPQPYLPPRFDRQAVAQGLEDMFGKIKTRHEKRNRNKG